MTQATFFGNSLYMKTLKAAWALIKQTFQGWSEDKAPRLGAALSYYTIFSLAPLLIVIISVAGLVFGHDAAQGKLEEQLGGLLGADGAKVVQTMVLKASEKKGGIIGTVVGLVTLLVGATGVVIELQDALNTVWKVIPKPGRGIMGILRDRVLSFGLILGFGFLLIVSLVMSALLAALGGWLSNIIPGWVILGYVLSYGVSFVIIALMFAMIFKLLPDVKMGWRDVWIGSAVTSALFHVGKLAIGLYLGKASVGSAFGAAGSLAVLLVWIYYTTQLLFFGAEFTRAYADKYGSHVVPADNALPAPDAAALRPAAEREIKAGRVPPTGPAPGPTR
jgi:membrane protein